MPRALAAILAALALSATACSGAPTPRGSTSAAPRLLEAALDAQGGRGAIERIEAVRESAKVEYRGNSMRVTTLLARPDKLRQVITRGDTEQHSILDGERAWAVIKSAGKPAVTSEMLPAGVARLRELRKNWVPLLGAEAEQLTELPKGERFGSRCHVLQAVDGRGRVRRFWLDGDTHLLAAITAGKGDEEVVYRYTDYREVRSLGGGAVRWPHEIVISVGGRVTKRIRTVRIELDPELPPKAFRP